MTATASQQFWLPPLHHSNLSNSQKLSSSWLGSCPSPAQVMQWLPFHCVKAEVFTRTVQWVPLSSVISASSTHLTAAAIWHKARNRWVLCQYLGSEVLACRLGSQALALVCGVDPTLYLQNLDEIWVIKSSSQELNLKTGTLLVGMEHYVIPLENSLIIPTSGHIVFSPVLQLIITQWTNMYIRINVHKSPWWYCL